MLFLSVTFTVLLWMIVNITTVSRCASMTSAALLSDIKMQKAKKVLLSKNKKCPNSCSKGRCDELLGSKHLKAIPLLDLTERLSFLPLKIVWSNKWSFVNVLATGRKSSAALTASCESLTLWNIVPIVSWALDVFVEISGKAALKFFHDLLLAVRSFDN